MRKRKLSGAQGYTGFKKVQIITDSYLENCYERQHFKFNPSKFPHFRKRIELLFSGSE